MLILKTPVIYTLKCISTKYTKMYFIIYIYINTYTHVRVGIQRLKNILYFRAYLKYEFCANF